MTGPMRAATSATCRLVPWLMIALASSVLAADWPAYRRDTHLGAVTDEEPVERIYLWGMQVYGERPGEFTAAVACFGPRRPGAP